MTCTFKQSTTATPSGRKFTASPIALALGLTPTASAITLPVSVHALGPNDMGLAVIIGMAPALTTLLIVATLAAAYVIAFLVAVLVTFGRLLRGRTDAVRCVEDLFRHVINPVVLILTLTPVKASRSATAATKRVTATTAGSPLPAVPGAARTEIEALYWELRREREDKSAAESNSKPEPEPVTVPAAEPVTLPSRGRHAKPGAPDETTVEVSVPDAEPAVKAAA